ncbi:MAG: DUF1016 family protein [Nitrosomonas sp.]|nr:DUF1016 family protein [Nitrosomonas sp.]
MKGQTTPESELESAIIDKLEHFLLELSRDFCSRPGKSASLSLEHFFVDLVFFNRLLRCYVPVDLKINRLSHGDLEPRCRCTSITSTGL